MLMSSAWYRHSYSGLAGAIGPYQATVDAGSGTWGQSGLGKHQAPAVWYDLPFLSSAGMDRKRSGALERTLMVPTTRNLLEMVIGKFAGIMANDLMEGAGQGIQVVTSIADIAHHIVGLGEGEPPDSCPEECRTLGNRTWGQVIYDLASAWDMEYDMDDPATAF